ncbi:hypothetical protein D9756_010769 [Leucocoprinus leucothites]|uniref:EF-hand domain-containing protein n=1 Tax=Leucocoprinus leucothites TaxID=201217 RepID=A0A8H5CWX6_9AGAR|nr:hypothetical protein D9756_010769 [Leucoagaricus leucothites]
MSDSPPKPDLNAKLQSAHRVVQSIPETPGKKERILDKAAENTAIVSDDWQKFEDFYNSNGVAIKAAEAGLASLENQNVKNAIKGLKSTVDVIVKGLDIIAEIHPFVKVAVTAFKVVAQQDMTRRENNGRVSALRFKMTQMICTLFQLREVRDPVSVGSDGKPLQSRMEHLMTLFAEHISDCGGFCNLYCEKNVFSRTLRADHYANLFQSHASRLMDDSHELFRQLSIHIGQQVDIIADGIHTTVSKVNRIDEKLDKFLGMFDSEVERDMIVFIKEHKGANAVVANPDLVERLFEKSGESREKFVKKGGDDAGAISVIQETMKKVLIEDIDAKLKDHLTLIAHKMETNTNLVVRAIGSGVHDQVLHADLQYLWKVMRWNGSVRAIRFAHGLRDYFTGQFRIARSREVASPASPYDDAISNQAQILPDTGPEALVRDEWARDYLHVAYLQPILEAIDDDGTGFISIKEANTFAAQVPAGWNLLKWVAYWAKGWEISLADYKNKILSTLQQMVVLRSKILDVNANFVDQYFDSSQILGIERIMRSLKTEREYYNVHPELMSLTKCYTEAEEARLRKELEKIQYAMDNVPKFTDITGPGRIERFLLPILYLVLKRHLEVFQYACHNVVYREYHFMSMANSLDTIFCVVDERIDNLRGNDQVVLSTVPAPLKDSIAVHKQMRADSEAYLENIALGMFHGYTLHREEYYGSKDGLIPIWHNIPILDEFDPVELIGDPSRATLILTKESNEPPTADDELNLPIRSLGDEIPLDGNICGDWTGHVWCENGRPTEMPGRVMQMIQLRIENELDTTGVLGGSALTWSQRMEVTGKMLGCNGEDGFFFVLRPGNEPGTVIRFRGKVNVNEGSLEGSWDEVEDHCAEETAVETPPTAENVEAETSQTRNRFEFRRTPPEVYHFRSLLNLDVIKAQARWKFALESVKWLVRRSLWSWRHFKTWSVDRKTFLDLYQRDTSASIDYRTPHQPLTPEEQDQFDRLKECMPPLYIFSSVKAVRWYLDRLPSHVGIYCNECFRLIDDTPRYSCTVCVDSKLISSFDLCFNCKDNSTFTDQNFKHNVDHQLVKFRRVTPAFLFSSDINSARRMVEFVRENYSAPPNLSGQTDEAANDPNLGSKCSQCKKPVTLPFWVCMRCTYNSGACYYLCDDCELRGPVKMDDLRPVDDESHRRIHSLVRFTSLREFEDTAESVIETVADLEMAIKTRFEALDVRIARLERLLDTLMAVVQSNQATVSGSTST